MIVSSDGRFKSDDPKLIAFHNTRNNPRRVICIKDNPAMVGFGRVLKSGDIVVINGTVHQYFGFAVSVPNECAFYDYTHFEPCDDFLTYNAELSRLSALATG